MSIAALLTAAPAAAGAQSDASPPRGIFATLGVGGGAYACARCPSLDPGVSMQVMLGAFVSPRVIIGLEVSRWTKEQRRAEYEYLSFGLSAQLYPSPTSGFFLRGGFGATQLEASGFTAYLDNPTPSGGLGLGGGAGYDIAALGRFSITPYALVGLGRVGGGSAVHAQAGVAVTYR